MARKTSIATILYPENVTKAEYVARVGDLHINAYMSPLHTDEGKKEHYHLMLFFGSPKSDKQIKEIVERIGGVGCEPIINNRGYARYLCHLDNPEKKQYSPDDVLEFGTIEHYSGYV